MGAGAAKQPTAPLLDRLTGREPIPSDDRFWQELLASAVSLPAGSSVEDVTAISRAYCAELVRNNPRSGNFGALAAAMAERLGRATRSAATDTEMQQACGAVFLLRIFLKHMLETLEPEDVALQLRGRDVAAAAQAPGSASAAAEPVQARPPGGSEDTEAAVARLIVEALLGAAASCRLDDVSYALHMEVLAALTVCLSAQLFSELSASVPLPTVTAALGAPPPLAEALVARLLKLYIDQPPRPANPEGRLLGSIGSMLWLPLQDRRAGLAVLGGAAGASPPCLSPVSAAGHRLLLPRAGAAGRAGGPVAAGAAAADAAPSSRPLPRPDALQPLSRRAAVRGRCRLGVRQRRGGGRGAREAGRGLLGAQAARRALRAAARGGYPRAALPPPPRQPRPDAGGAVRGPARGPLAPLTRRPPLWAGNRELLDHALSRSDPDALLLPLLRTLAGMLSPACRLRTSRVCARASPHAGRCPTTARPRDSTKPIRLPDQVYMLLIILLMLSQDGGFVSTAHAVMLPTVPWFKERPPRAQARRGSACGWRPVTAPRAE